MVRHLNVLAYVYFSTFHILLPCTALQTSVSAHKFSLCLSISIFYSTFFLLTGLVTVSFRDSGERFYGMRKRRLIMTLPIITVWTYRLWWVIYRWSLTELTVRRWSAYLIITSGQIRSLEIRHCSTRQGWLILIKYFSIFFILLHIFELCYLFIYLFIESDLKTMSFIWSS